MSTIFVGSGRFAANSTPSVAAGQTCIVTPVLLGNGSQAAFTGDALVTVTSNGHGQVTVYSGNYPAGPDSNWKTPGSALTLLGTITFDSTVAASAVYRIRELQASIVLVLNSYTEDVVPVVGYPDSVGIYVVVSD